MSEESLKRINAAAVAMSEELLAAGFQIASRLQKERELSDYEINAAAGNAYQQVMAAAWSVYYDIDLEDMGGQLMRFLKDYLRDAPRRESS